MDTIDTKLLRISSYGRDYDESKSSSDFIVNFKNSSDVQGVTSIVPKNITFPNVFYNVNSYKNTFRYKIAGVPQSFSITVGQYTEADFESAVTTAGTSIGLTLTLDPITKKYDFTTTTAIQYLPFYSREKLPPPSDLSNGMGEILGLYEGTSSDVSSHTASGLVNLAGESDIYIVSNRLSDGNRMIASTLFSVPVLTVVPIKVPFGQYIHWEANEEQLEMISYSSQGEGNSLQKVDIKLVDREGRTLSLNGLDIELIVKILY